MLCLSSPFLFLNFLSDSHHRLLQEEGSFALGTHCICVCFQTMEAISFVEDGAGSLSLLAVGSQSLKVNIFIPFPKGTKQGLLKLHGTQPSLVGKIPLGTNSPS